MEGESERTAYSEMDFYRQTVRIAAYVMAFRYEGGEERLGFLKPLIRRPVDTYSSCDDAMCGSTVLANASFVRAI